MSFSSSFGINESYSKIHNDIPTRFNSFDQCNKSLLDLDEIDIYDYLDVTSTIPHDNELAKYCTTLAGVKWIQSVIEYLVTISQYDTHDFCINPCELKGIGFDIIHYSSKTPKWFQETFGCYDNQLKQECRFLKHHKLIQNVDYIEKTGELGGDVILFGYQITKHAVYKLMTHKYGNRFVESIVGRISQLLYYFNDYKQVYKSKTIESLRRTIYGLNEDIVELNKQIQEIKNSKVIPIIDFDKGFGDSILSYGYSSSLSSRSNIDSDVIMSDKEYTDELIAVHKKIESFVEKVDSRISNVQDELNNINLKINDLVGSIALSREGSNSTDNNKRNSDPVLDHVQSIFQEYEHHIQMNRNTMPIMHTRPSMPQRLINNTFI